tara:strand:+ start:1405 stop:1770 length:366 start_codon:yes stop_codon:yes gene_type:complete
MKYKNRNASPVYSSVHGSVCPDCSEPVSRCRCAGQNSKPPSSIGVVRVGRETKGRKGKGVTVVTGLLMPVADLQQLAKKLKVQCGAGGTTRDGVIEIQGEHRDTVIRALETEGIVAKKAGG